MASRKPIRGDQEKPHEELSIHLAEIGAAHALRVMADQRRFKSATEEVTSAFSAGWRVGMQLAADLIDRFGVRALDALGRENVRDGGRN